MPRGNDPTATRDLANQYGDGHGNAEDLIAHHDNVLLDPELQRALSKAVDPAATDALNLNSIKPKHGGTIMSAAIRGGRLVVVEDVDGHYVKWHDDVPSSAGAKRAAHVDPGAKGRKDAAVRAQGENPTGDPTQNDGGTGATGDDDDSNDTGNGDGDGDDGQTGDDDENENGTEAPEGVTIPMIREKLGTLSITPPREVRRKDDLWALLPEDAQAEVAGSTAPAS